MAALKFERDTGIGESERAGFEALGEDFRVEVERQEEGEIGGGAGPPPAVAEKVLDGSDEERGGGSGGIESGADFVDGTGERRGGGGHPLEGVGMAGGARSERGGGIGENGGNGIADGAEDAGQQRVELVEQALFGPATVGRERRKIDDEGAGGEIGRGSEIGGDSEEDGALERELDRVPVAVFPPEQAGAAGQPAQGIADGGRERAHVIEGEKPVFAGERKQVAEGGEGREGRGAGIDKAAEDARSEGLAAAGRAAQNEDGIGAAGAQGAEEPGQAGEPAVAEIEGGAQGFGEAGGRRVRGCGLRNGQGAGGEGDLEIHVGACGDFPAASGDFDVFAGGGGEVEQDFLGEGVGAAGGDTARDEDAAAVGVGGGLGFEMAADGAPGVGGGDGLVGGVGLVEKPLAKGAGADGEAAVTVEGSGGDAREGAAVAGGEGQDAAGDDVVGGEARGLRRSGSAHECHLTSGVADGEAGVRNSGLEVVEGVGEIGCENVGTALRSVKIQGGSVIDLRHNSKAAGIARSSDNLDAKPGFAYRGGNAKHSDQPVDHG